jgi:diadenosine tetraphosphate (Ap4A) HIT family hydrolase
MITSWMLKLARSKLFGNLVSWTFTHMHRIIPGKRLYETEYLMAIGHPKPSYAVHVLLVPKKPYPSYLAIPPEELNDFMQELHRAVAVLVESLGLQDRGYRLIVNGGAYQDVPHLHFHLVSGTPPPT